MSWRLRFWWIEAKYVGGIGRGPVSSDEDGCQRNVLYILVFVFDVVGYLPELPICILIDKKIDVRKRIESI